LESGSHGLALNPNQTIVDFQEEIRNALAADVVGAAPLLLGAVLRRGNLSARIVEVEAYRSLDDSACHAHGKTRMKNMVLFGAPGRSYIYFCYGTHWMLNISAHSAGDAAGILIRAAEPLSGIETFRERRPKAHKDTDLLSGPGKLATAFGITNEDNDLDLLSASSPLRIESGERSTHVLVGPRVGIAIGKAHDFPWRFADGEKLRWVSRPHNFEV